MKPCKNLSAVSWIETGTGSRSEIPCWRIHEGRRIQILTDGSPKLYQLFQELRMYYMIYLKVHLDF